MISFDEIVLMLFISFIVAYIICHFSVFIISMIKSRNDMMQNKSNDNQKKNKRSILLLTSKHLLCYFVFSIISTSFYFFYKKFKNGDLSGNMQDWGAYATCLATITSFVSIILIYMTYKSQSEMYKEQSRVAYLSKFNEVFTNMLQVQRELYNKTNPNIFYELHNHVNFLLKDVSKSNVFINKTVEDIELSFRSFIKKAYGTFFSRNFEKYSISLLVSDNCMNSKFTPREFDNLRNYFKYLYHLVIYVARNEELTAYDKKVYMNLIQAQMSTDELFCYMINVMDYYFRVDGRVSNSISDDVYKGANKDEESEENKENKAYINILYQYNFFEDLFRKPNDVETREQLDELFYDEFDFDFKKHRRNENPRKYFNLFPIDPC